MASFKTIDHFDIPKQEEKVLEYWAKIDAFHQQNRLNEGNPKYTFYDGPPFATGLPHYGHICAGTIKDVVCRFAAQSGFYVERRFGWDCHGLPIQNIIDNELQIKSKKQVHEMGIDKYNNECRKIVQKYSSEWKYIITRFGRWIDFENDYKTMNLSFMESVWWVFKEMFKKGLVYRGRKIMPYSNSCNTVLSNFELALNYKNTIDPSVHVLFELADKPGEYLMAWTTTPWTLPSNLALAVNPSFTYLKVSDKDGRVLILGESRVGDVFKKAEDYKVLQKISGKSLVGLEYKPLFPYFESRKKDGCFRVLEADYVTAEAGTCIVHTAPGFGADDYKICVKNGLITPDNPPVPIDDSGNFTKEVSDFAGKYIKDADKDIKKHLKERKLLYKEGTIQHSYPFCWRSETPLVYKAVTAWFINVSSMRGELVKNNLKTHWVPKTIQEGKFNNWLEGAEDWCFSRNRFWGNPIPLWVSEDGEEVVCVGSIAELKELTGAKEVTDLHRQFIDGLQIPSKMGKGKLRRIDEVFDCWFQSGSMPFAQVHYPFGISEAEFAERFPADFVGEGIDQTRGWFYTLNVISNAVKGCEPYHNLIVNGLVMNEKGKKMSKKDKNYPDPLEVTAEHGADAVRLYMINSPVVKAENLDFSKKGVKGVVKDVFLPWINSVKFFIQNAKKWEDGHRQFLYSSEVYEKNTSRHILDRWIVSCLQDLVGFFRAEMKEYRLYTVVPKLVRFLDQLTNGYVRFNRPILRGDQGEDDQLLSLNVLFGVLLDINILLAPFVPFITESLYQVLRDGLPDSPLKAASVHFLRIPQAKPEHIDLGLEAQVARMTSIIEQGRFLREQSGINIKHPVQSLKLVSRDPKFVQSMSKFNEFIKEEINVEAILYEKDTETYFAFQATPNHKELGKKLKKAYSKDFIAAVNSLSKEQIAELASKGEIEILGVKLNSTTDIQVKELLSKQRLKPQELIGQVDTTLVVLDYRQTEQLKMKGEAREVVNRIQRLKKKCRVKPDDDIVFYIELGESLSKSYLANRLFVEQVVKKPTLPLRLYQGAPVLGESKELYEEKDKLNILLTVNSVYVHTERLVADFGPKGELAGQVLRTSRLDEFKKQVKEGKFQLQVQNERLCLVEGLHFQAGVRGVKC